MGFSTQNGKNAHESLVARQDSEIRLLELMRRCLLQKVKCDREYASAIASVAQQGLKIDKTDDLNGEFSLLHLFYEHFKTKKKRKY